MIASQNMVAEADIVHHQVLDVQFRLCVSDDRIDLSSSSSSSSVSPSSANDSVSAKETTCFESGLSCSDGLTDAVMEPPKINNYLPCMRSGSYADIGSRMSMDDEHIRIDDLSPYLGSLFKFCTPIAFYAVFDGHGGPEAARYIKENAMKLFFGESVLPKTSEVDDTFLQELESSHRQAFLLADLALADECSISSSCGTTALTALVLGKHLVIANAGDCRAVLGRRGVAVELSHDHRPSYLPERKRVEELGGSIRDGYLDGYLSVTRALGDWDMKLPRGSASPLTAVPDIQQVILSEEDEFLIIACDGIWDVMSSQYAVSLVRQGLRRHNDPQQCARDLVMDALRLNTSDNLTAVVVCFSAGRSPQRPRLRCCSLSEEARNRLRSLLGGN